MAERDFFAEQCDTAKLRSGPDTGSEPAAFVKLLAVGNKHLRYDPQELSVLDDGSAIVEAVGKTQTETEDEDGFDF